MQFPGYTPRDVYGPAATIALKLYVVGLALKYNGAVKSNTVAPFLVSTAWTLSVMTSA